MLFKVPGAMSSDGFPATVTQPDFAAINSTIYNYTALTMNAFKKVKIANVDKVTLEFGIEVGGEAGIPYVTKGTAKSNLKITVECSFPEQTEPQTETK
jgi:Trypsin-co-occurring domain 1